MTITLPPAMLGKCALRVSCISSLHAFYQQRRVAQDVEFAGPFGLLAHWLTEFLTMKVRSGGEGPSLKEKVEATRRIKQEWEQKLAQEEASKGDS
jgi:hypothetical protein